MQTSLRRYVILFAVLTAATPFLASALVQAFPNHAKTIEDLLGIPAANSTPPLLDRALNE